MHTRKTTGKVCWLLLMLLVTGVSLGTGSAWAKAATAKRSPAVKATGPERDAIDVMAQIVFTAEDRRLIEAYYRDGAQDSAQKAPPGLAKRDRLPPGLEKQLERNGTLPPGLQGRGLPGDLERRLSRLPAGYERRRVGADVVLIETATRVILDIIYGVGR